MAKEKTYTLHTVNTLFRGVAECAFLLFASGGLKFVFRLLGPLALRVWNFYATRSIAA